MCSGGVVGLGGPPPHQVRYGQAHHSPQPALYAFDDREKILDILGHITGLHLTYCYARFGGVILDIDDIFLDNVSNFCTYFVERLKEYEKLIIGNVIFREREMSGTDQDHPQVGRKVCGGNWKLYLLKVHGRADYELTGV